MRDITPKYGFKDRLKVLGHAFGAFGLGFAAAATGRPYEGSRQTRHRARPATVLESQDKALDLGDREALISEARNLEQNVGLVGSIAEKYQQGVVGRCELRWNTGDPDIDRRYRDAWLKLQDSIDYRGERSFRDLTKLAVSQGLFIEGDIFGQHLAQRSTSGRAIGYNLSMIEADRIGSATHGINGVDRPNLIGGCFTNSVGQVTGYQLRDRAPYGQFRNPRPIPRYNLLHLRDTGHRVDAYRGVTRLKAVLDAIRDWKETTAAQVLTAKVHSRHAIVNKVAGGAPRGVGGHSGILDNRANQLGATESTVEEVGDQMIRYIFPGEDVQALRAEVPSDGWLNLMEMTVAHIARGAGLPFSVVWRMVGTGPAVRADMEEADKVFLNIHRLLVKQWYRPIGMRAIRVQIDAGLLPDHPLWWNIGARKPRKQSIDFGRDMRVAIDLLKYGVIDEFDFCETWLDTDFEEVAPARGRAARLINDVAAREGVEPREIRLITQNDTAQVEEHEAPENVEEPIAAA